MKSMKKAVVLMLCVASIAAASVFGTMAYFTSQDVVENTFTVGNVKITLDEANVDGLDKDGNDNKDVARDIANNYKLIPGKEYVKDPIIHVDATSEDCWLFVKLENGLKDIIADTTIENQMIANGWALVPGDNNSENNIYSYKTIVNADYRVDADAVKGDIPVFETFTVKGDNIEGVKPTDPTEVDGSKKYLSDYSSNTIKVTAYAIQAHGFDTAQKAWDAAYDELN